MKPLRLDPAVYYSIHSGSLQGISGIYVDDMLRAGNPTFRNQCKLTGERFEMSEDDNLPCLFSGFSFRYSHQDNTLTLTQDKYGQKLQPLGPEATFSDFASTRMQVQLLAHSRPDISYEISQLTQVTTELFKTSKTDIIRVVNRVINQIQAHTVEINFPKLCAKTLHFIGYSDASFGTNHVNSSQLGYIIFLRDRSGKVIPLHYKSYKYRRVARSEMATEIFAFEDMFDFSFTMAEELRLLLRTLIIPLKLYTDNKSLFDVISEGKRTAEESLILDVAVAREGFSHDEISDIGFVRCEHNLADGHTKRMKQAALLEVLDTGILQPKIAQWIIRPQADISSGADM